MAGPLAKLYRFRSLLQSVYGGFAPRARRRIPAAQCRFSAFVALRRRAAAAPARRHPSTRRRAQNGSRRQVGGPSHRRAELHSARGDHGQSARIHHQYPPLVRADPRGNLSSLYQLSAGCGAGGLMFYSIRHLTKFRYSSEVSESLMEVRMNPRSEGLQRCLSFNLSVTPRARVQQYRDYLGNVVHHFNVPSPHRHLTIVAEAMVDLTPQPALQARLEPGAWE